MMQNRIKEIDILKGIGIIMVLCSHFIPSVSILQYLLKFDSAVFIPLFFFASGLSNSIIDKSNIIRKSIKLLVPYIFFYVLFYTIGEFCSWENNQLWGMLYSRYWITIGETTTIIMPAPYGPLWFLTAMISTTAIISITSGKSIERYHGGWILIILLATISYITNKYIGCLPWSIENAPLYASYYYFAKFLKTKDTNLHPSVLTVLFVIYTLLSNTVGNINWSLSIFGINYFYTYAVSIIGIFSFYSLAKKMKGALANALSFVGRESLGIFATHLFFSIIIRSICDACLKDTVFFDNYHKQIHLITLGVSVIITLILAPTINSIVKTLTNKVTHIIKAK